MNEAAQNHGSNKNVAVWLVLLAAAGTFALTMGTRQTMGLFLSPLNTATGLGIGSISLAFAFGQLWWGLTQPFAGAFADKIGAGRVLFIGVALVALGTVLTPLMTSTAGLIFAIGVLAAGGAGMAGPAVLMAATTRMIPASRRGMATGIVNAGGSFGQFLMAPIAGLLTASLGWASAMQVLGLIVLLALPAAFLLKGNSLLSAAPGVKPVGTREAIATALRNPSYLMLAGGFFVCGFHVAFLATHLPGVVASCGLPLEVGAWSLAIIGLFNIVGSFAMGWAVGPLAHEVAAVAAVRHARAGRAGLPAGAQDHRRDAGVRRGDGDHFPVHRAAHRGPRRQVLRAGQHGHAVRHRDAHAPDRRLPRCLARRQGVRSHRQLQLGLVHRHRAGGGGGADPFADPGGAAACQSRRGCLT